jgi:type III secretory pathway component EscV
MVSGYFRTRGRLYVGPASRLRAAGIAADSQSSDGYWVREDDWHKALKSGLKLLEPLEALIHHLRYVLEANLPELIGIQETCDLIAAAGADRLTAITRTRHLPQMRDVLQLLVEERVPITSIEDIVDRFIELADEGADTLSMVSGVRGLRAIRPRLPGNDPNARFHEVDDSFVAAIRKGIATMGSTPLLILAPAESDRLIKSLRPHLQHEHPEVLIVDDPAIRRALKMFIQGEWRNAEVLTRQEVRPSPSRVRGDVVRLL